ncbi:coiled-coil domain-containing protein 112 isoform X2 [Bombyx mori]|uniref:Uncharacterized protein n=1 Tax=Bombyx mori TaxID=7091 RepID=A0A8R2GBC3_BOMMO|nr:coiled-coil domain-containing protein 112 isoform X1 [Bombyx mori]
MSNIQCTISNSVKSKDSDTKDIEDIDEESILAKIKRLKIEENHLMQAIRKHSYSFRDADDVATVRVNYDSQSNKNNLEKSIRELKDMFVEIRMCTNSSEILRSIDIHEIKTTIVEFEKRLKSFTLNLRSEMVEIKNDENQILAEMKQNSNITNKIRIPKSHLHSATYKDMVPSPVKLFMNSPFKCPAVQEFQEFIANSKNRHGGWNEYYHNIFVKTWMKYFRLNSVDDFDMFVSSLESSEYFNDFLFELQEKLQVFKMDDIISHFKWYAKFVYLKENQQKAINKWKTKRNLVKQSSKMEFDKRAQIDLQRCTSARENSDTIIDEGNRWDLVKESMDSIMREPENPNGLHKDEKDTSVTDLMANLFNKERKLNDYRRPTAQWINRCKTTEEKQNCFNNETALETISKRGVPSWRTNL